MRIAPLAGGQPPPVWGGARPARVLAIRNRPSPPPLLRTRKPHAAQTPPERTARGPVCSSGGNRRGGGRNRSGQFGGGRAPHRPRLRRPPRAGQQPLGGGAGR